MCSLLIQSRPPPRAFFFRHFISSLPLPLLLLIHHPSYPSHNSISVRSRELADSFLPPPAAPALSSPPGLQPRSTRTYPAEDGPLLPLSSRTRGKASACGAFPSALLISLSFSVSSVCKKRVRGREGEKRTRREGNGPRIDFNDAPATLE